MAQPSLASVIINNYNYGRFVGAAIDSALAQTHACTEVIVVDDGSTDNSRDVLASYGARIKTVFKENGGQASALNAGFEMSHGDVILFLDADDTLLPSAVDNAVRTCKASDVVKAHWPLWIVNERGERTGKVTPSAPLPDGDLKEVLLRDGPLTTATPPTSGNAWTRGFLQKVMPIPADYRLCADEYLYALAPAFGIVKRVEKPQGTYRMHGHNGYQGKTLDEKTAFGRRIQDLQCDLVAAHLRSLGHDAAPERWKRKQWFCRLGEAIATIRAVIPPSSMFILVDDDQWGVQHSLAGRACLPFVEKDGAYWGPPPNDRAATEELMRLRAVGADFLVVAWPAFWWLSHYRDWHQNLMMNYRCIVRSDDLLVFDLRETLVAQRAPEVLCESH